MIAVLDWDIQEQASHCTHCLRLLHKATSVVPEGDRLNAAYCSKDCQTKSNIQSHNLLFGLEPLLPLDMDVGAAVAPKEERDKAQQALTDHLKAEKKNISMLAARYFARQITIETSRMLPPTTPTPDELPKLTEDNSPEYGLSDHFERLRYLDFKVPEEQTKLICSALGAALPGLEQSLNEERHATTVGKMAYNAIGICYSGGRDDRVSHFTFYARPAAHRSSSRRLRNVQKIRRGLVLRTVHPARLGAAFTLSPLTYVAPDVL